MVKILFRSPTDPPRRRTAFNEKLKSQLLEEPLVLAGLVLLLELRSYHHTCFLFLHGVLKSLLVEVGLVERDLDSVPSRHHVIVVHHLQEGFDGRPPLYLLLAHTLGHFTGISVDTRNESVREGLVTGSLIARLHDNSLPLYLLLAHTLGHFTGIS